MSIGMKPFKASYGYEDPRFEDLVFLDSQVPLAKDWVQ